MTSGKPCHHERGRALACLKRRRTRLNFLRALREKGRVIRKIMTWSARPCAYSGLSGANLPSPPCPNTDNTLQGPHPTVYLSLPPFASVVNAEGLADILRVPNLCRNGNVDSYDTISAFLGVSMKHKARLVQIVLLKDIVLVFRRVVALLGFMVGLTELIWQPRRITSGKKTNGRADKPFTWSLRFANRSSWTMLVRYSARFARSFSLPLPLQKQLLYPCNILAWRWRSYENQWYLCFLMGNLERKTEKSHSLWNHNLLRAVEKWLVGTVMVE